jgi:hypothetical protein
MTHLYRNLRTIVIAGLALLALSAAAVYTGPARLESWLPVDCTVLAIRGVDHCYPATDADSDGIPDAYEAALLNRYRPFYRFSDDGGPDPYRPLDPVQYLRQSSLIGIEVAKCCRGIRSQIGPPLATSAQLSRDPSLALRDAGIDAPGTHVPGAAQCGFAAVLPPDGAAFLHGAPWSQVLSAGNIGLFGHVVPAGPAGLYVVEYWQFFGYNVGGGPWGIANHEGDWATVQLVVQPADRSHEVVRTLHSHHGDVDTFVFRDAKGVQTKHTQGAPFAVPGGGKIVEYATSSNSVLFPDAVQMYEAPGESLYLHPVVYIEHGGHEFWPTSWGFKSWAHNHNGESYQLLTRNVPNLGEVSAPMSAEAAVITRYTGYWGYRNSSNAPPPGPSLHTEWSWPRREATLRRQVATCAEA